MVRWGLVLSGVGLLPALWLTAQQNVPGIPAPVLRATTQLVQLDVVVTDKSGQPVRGLTREDFVVEEKGKPQKIATFGFSQHSAASHSGPPPLPENIYTNRVAYRTPTGPVTILMLDGLNTPIQNQAYARQQLIQYLATQFKAGQRMAVFGLSNSLSVLQDFTSDPELLRAALESAVAGKSSLLPDANRAPNTRTPAESSVRGGGAQFEKVLANVRQFQSEQDALALDTRVAVTLTALRTVARAVAGYPGRKNLIWVSAAFPLVLTPDTGDGMNSIIPLSQRAGFNTIRQYADDIRRTSSYLSDAQVAVYPVDARGLVGAPLNDASSSGLNDAGLLRMGADYGNQVAKQSGNLIETQFAMNAIAQETGGRAYFSRNDIDNAVALAVADGSVYYTLGYYVEDKNWDGQFRGISVKVDRPNVDVRHRPGYFAIDPVESYLKAKNKEKDNELAIAMRSDILPATMVIFDSRVIPPDPAAKMTVPVEFLVNMQTIAVEPQSGGKQHADLSFHAAAFSPEGKMVTAQDVRVDAPLKAETYQQFLQQGLPFKLELELAPGRYQLRLAVRDNRTGYLGTMEVPLILAASGNKSAR